MHKKVLVIFPKYSPNDSSHYSYWYPIFSEAGKSLDIKILFESPNELGGVKNTSIIDTPNLPKPISLLYRSYQIAKQMCLGYRKIYIHYSYSTFFIAKLLSIFSNSKIYYWNCEYYNSAKDSDKVLPIVLKLTDYLVTGGQMIGERYRKIFNLNKPIKIVSNYVSEVKSVKINLPKNKTHILFVHHISPRKGSRELPRIIQETIKLIPDSHFHIIGSGPDKELVRSLIINHGLSKHVTFYGALPRHETVAYFKSSDIFIMPSKSEGFPRVILEAMLYKIPIVSTNVGNVSELVGNIQKKYLVEVGKPRQFTQTIRRLFLSNPNTKMINENYKKVTEYNMDRSINEFIASFK